MGVEDSSGADIITLGNFNEKLPSWDPNEECHLYAIVDMGSNGIRFSISDLSPPQTRLLKCIYRERASISLFDALEPLAHDQHGFPPSTIHLVSATLSRFHATAKDHGVPEPHFSVLATEALRRACNGPAMIEAIRKATSPHTCVHVLEPRVETLFGAVMGARSAFDNVDQGGLFLDLGGGSVQMTWVDTSQQAYEMAAAKAGVSLPFGAAKLMGVLMRAAPGQEDARDEARDDELDKLSVGMRDAFKRLCDEFPRLRDRVASQDGIDVYMCGGGFRGYGSMLMHNDPIQPYPIPTIGTYAASGDVFSQVSKMRKVNEDHDVKIFGMSKRRRGQFHAIATVVEAVIAAVPRIRTATFCTGSNRDGCLMMKLPRQLRESSPLLALDRMAPPESRAASLVSDVLQAALPSNVDFSRIPTLFSLGLGPIFAREVWTRQGEEDEPNAAFAVHSAVARDPATPGMTQLVRAMLAVAMCARWGSALGSIDGEIYRGLAALLERAGGGKEVVFYARFVGAVAAVAALVMPAWTDDVDLLKRDMPRFFSNLVANRGSGKRDKIGLRIEAYRPRLRGLDTEDLVDLFKAVAKKKGDMKSDVGIDVVVRSSD